MVDSDFDKESEPMTKGNDKGAEELKQVKKWPKKEDMGLLKELKKNKKTTDIWELLMHSQDYRKALIQALSNITISTIVTPEEMIKKVIDKTTKMISF